MSTERHPRTDIEEAREASLIEQQIDNYIAERHQSDQDPADNPAMQVADLSYGGTETSPEPACINAYADLSASWWVRVAPYCER